MNAKKTRKKGAKRGEDEELKGVEGEGEKEIVKRLPRKTKKKNF